MGYSFELKGGRKPQETSKVVKDKIVAPRQIQVLKFQDKSKEGQFGQHYIDHHHEVRRDLGDRSLFPSKSTLNQQKCIGKKETNDDELVKHMKNLPGYLQQVDRGKNLQEKALNFGVLDWEHLEKWKDNKKHILQRGMASPSASSSNSSSMASSFFSHPKKVQVKNIAPQKNQVRLRCSPGDSYHGSGLSQNSEDTQGKVRQCQDSVTAPKSTLDGQRNVRRTSKSFDRNSEMRLVRGKKKGSHEKITSEKDTSLSDLRKHAVSLTAKDVMSSQDGKTMKKVEELQPSEFNLALRKRQSVVLLLPKHSPKKSCSDVFEISKPRISFDGKLTEANQKSFSCKVSSEEVYSPKLCSEILYPRLLPTSAESNTESDMKPHSSINAPDMVLPPDAFHTCSSLNELPAKLSEDKSIDENKAVTKPSNPNKDTKICDQETAESVSVRGRYSSPNHRFSFGLGKMGRSFSWKEGSAVPQLSPSYATVKSGPVRPEPSYCLDDSKGKKANFQSRARSSPLRRLLDPLLKPKTSNRHLSPKTVQPLKGKLNCSTPKLIDFSESFKDEKYDGSTVEAILQLTIKNGLPFFKLEVDNNSDILAATMKSLSTSGKNCSDWIYTFYSVHETKKKSGSWMNQGSRGRSCGFDYDVVGQMKVSCSNIPDLTAQGSENQFAAREYVLYGVNLSQKDQLTSELTANRELAAIVVNIPRQSSEDDGEQSNEGENLRGKGFTEHLQEDRNYFSVGENENSGSMTVILPGGVHGLPKKGLPSPLMNRWRSGGSCDCGGWDLGCKLRILTNQSQICKHLEPSTPCFTPDCLDLFLQGGPQEKKPLFSLTPFKKGIYSVEFKASISLLQAFSICIAFLSSQQSSNVMEVNNLSVTKPSQVSALTACDRIKIRAKVQGEVPAKYVPSPPPSPVGRV